MENIVGLINMDGFRIQKQFLCKELGLLKVGEDTASSTVLTLGSGGATSMKKMLDHADMLRYIFTSYPWAYRMAQWLTQSRHWKSWSLSFMKALSFMKVDVGV